METPSFYKILMDLPSQLGLPQGFIQKYPEIIPRNAKLRIASGATWKVRVEKLKVEDEERYFFTQGWTEFLQEMGLKRFELLVFSYAGNSTFNVTIYAANAYEKDSNFEINAHNPRFQVKMKESHYYRFEISEDFYEAAGLRGKGKVVLEYPGGKSVNVALITYMNRGGCSLVRLGGGWKKFWEKNKMSAGKTYSFEFLPRKKVIQVKHLN